MSNENQISDPDHGAEALINLKLVIYLFSSMPIYTQLMYIILGSNLPTLVWNIVQVTLVQTDLHIPTCT